MHSCVFTKQQIYHLKKTVYEKNEDFEEEREFFYNCQISLDDLSLLFQNFSV